MGMAATDSQFHVLAVDDSLIDRKLIERLLKNSSYHVTAVDSGSKALEFLGLHKDVHSKPSVSPHNHHDVEVNLIITDYCMPGMTGYDLLKKIKESSSLRNIPVVIMSSENVPSRISRCLEEGAEEFFLKPVRVSDVNRLKSHMMRTKNMGSQNTEERHKVRPDQEPGAHVTMDDAVFHEQLQEQESQQLQQQQQQASSNKRKSLEEELSTERTRPRYSGLAVVN